MPSAVPANAQYWMYTASQGWVQVPIQSINGNTVTLKLTDGGTGDAINHPDDKIVDIGGIGYVLPTINLNPTSGQHGSTVTVSGSNFEPNTLVHISVAGAGQVAATTSDATGAISSSFIVPPVAIGNVTVYATDGVNTAQATLTILSSVPSVSVSPSSWTMDAGQSETFAASASGGSGSYTGYQWYVNGVSQFGATASTFSFTPGSAGSYSITATVTDSSSMTSLQSNAATVTVNASPTVSIAPAGPLTMDVGQVQAFTATPSGGTGTLSYQWYLDGSAVGTNSASYSYTAALGSHSVTCRVTDSAPTPVTSPASNAVSVTVYSALVAPTVTPAPGTVDQGQTSSLTSTVVSTGSGGYVYQWLEMAPSGSYVAVGSNSASFSFVTTGSTATGVWSFELQVTDSASAVVTSNSVSVTVYVAPTVSVSPASTTLDIGQSQVFIATPSGGTGNYTTYQWYVNGSQQSGQFASTFTFATLSTGSYSITAGVTDNSSTTSVQSTAASVTVNASPTVSIAPVGPLSLDAGQVQAFTASASGGTGTLSYQWFLDGSAVGSNSASYSYTAAGTSHSVTCKVTDSASTPVTSSASNAVSVTVYSALVAPTVTPAPGTVDQGQTCSLTSTVVSTGSGGYIYQWFEMAPGGSYVAVGTGLTSFSFVTTGSTATGVWSFKLQVTDSNGAAVTSSAATVTVSSTSTATISLNPTSGSQGATVQVTGSNFEPNAIIHISVAGIGEVSSTTAASDGSFAVNYVIPNGISLGNVAVTASDGIKSAQTTLTVLQPGEAQTTTTVSGNSVTVDQTGQTGVSVTVTGPSLSDGSQVTVTTQNYGMSSPAGITGALSVGTTFFDVQVLKTGGGTFGNDVIVTVSLTDPSFTSDMNIYYYTGSGWQTADNQHFDMATYTITGDIPASALSGTPVAVGTMKSSTAGLTLSATSLLIIIVMIVAVVVILGMLFVYMKKRKAK